MSSHADLAGLADMAERRAERRINGVREEAALAARQDVDALRLRAQCGAQLQDAQLGTALGLDRQQLWERLRLLAVARAHALDCELRAQQLCQQADAARERASALQREARHYQSHARRLRAVYAHLHGVQVRAHQRRLEREIQEEYACR